jgi:flagellin-like protein
MKGVSDVIAIILILMIVIALAALAYTWFTGVFTSLTASAGTAVTQTTTSMTTQFKMESARCSTKPCAAGSTLTFILRNVGTQQFVASKDAYYIDNIVLTGVGVAPTGATSCSGPAASCTNAPFCQLATNYLVGTGCVVTQTRTNILATDPIPTCDSSIAKVTIEGGISDTVIVKC